MESSGVGLRGFVEYLLTPKDLDAWGQAKQERQEQIKPMKEKQQQAGQEEEEEEESKEPEPKKRRTKEEEDRTDAEGDQNDDDDDDDEGEGVREDDDEEDELQWELPCDIADSNENAVEAAMRVFEQSTEIPPASVHLLAHVPAIPKFVVDPDGDGSVEAFEYYLAEAPSKVINNQLQGKDSDHHQEQEDADDRFIWVGESEARSMLRDREDRNVLFIAKRYLQEAARSGLFLDPNWKEYQKHLLQESSPTAGTDTGPHGSHHHSTTPHVHQPMGQSVLDVLSSTSPIDKKLPVTVFLSSFSNISI